MKLEWIAFAEYYGAAQRNNALARRLIAVQTSLIYLLRHNRLEAPFRKLVCSFVPPKDLSEPHLGAVVEGVFEITLPHEYEEFKGSDEEVGEYALRAVRGQLDALGKRLKWDSAQLMRIVDDCLRRDLFGCTELIHLGKTSRDGKTRVRVLLLQSSTGGTTVRVEAHRSDVTASDVAFHKDMPVLLWYGFDEHQATLKGTRYAILDRRRRVLYEMDINELLASSHSL